MYYDSLAPLHNASHPPLARSPRHHTACAALPALLVTCVARVERAWRRMLRRRQAAADAVLRVVRQVAVSGSRAFARGAPDAAPAKAAKGGRQKGGGERNVRAWSRAFGLASAPHSGCD